MAKTPEGKVKAAVVQQLRALGVYYFSPVTGGFGRSGVPDIVACYNGMFVGIECKAGKNQPTQLQLANLQSIAANGGLALTVNETTMRNVASMIAAAYDIFISERASK
jgi:hypothetical protein